MYININ